MKLSIANSVALWSTQRILLPLASAANTVKESTYVIVCTPHLVEICLANAVLKLAAGSWQLQQQPLFAAA